MVSTVIPVGAGNLDQAHLSLGGHAARHGYGGQPKNASLPEWIPNPPG